MTARAIALGATLALALSGCGGGGSDEAATPEPSGLVETSLPCEEVWVAGETLPEDYQSCLLEDDTLVAPPAQPCPSGAQFAIYENRLYAVPGETIQESAGGEVYTDPAYLEFTESC